MAELRRVDPNTLRPNPDNPRRVPAPKAMDDQLIASIRAIGIIQPPSVTERDGNLVIIAGNRRVAAAIAAGLAEIDVLVAEADEANDAMRSVSENLIRASMNSVDIWRAIDGLTGRGWNEQAIADALALPLRDIRRLKLLGKLHPPMLEAIARGGTPQERQLRTIASASIQDQAQVWKKHKPKKGEPAPWHQVAHALDKRRMPFSAAKFGEDLARAYGVVWEEDLFAPADEDGRYTMNVEGFLGAQQEWLRDNLPKNGRMFPTDEHGSCQLPKKADRTWGQPKKGDFTAHYVDPQSGEVRVIGYQLPEPKKSAKGAEETVSGAPVRARPDVTEKGRAMIGEFRTQALHRVLREQPIDDVQLIALLVLALGGDNVQIDSTSHPRHPSDVAHSLSENGYFATDPDTIRNAARETLAMTLSCQENRTNSGGVARVAGLAFGADQFLPNMATEDFLSCLNKAAMERAASAAGVLARGAAKATRAALIQHIGDGAYVYPAAQFALSDQEVADARHQNRRVWDDDSGDGEPGEEQIEERGIGDELSGSGDGFDTDYPLANAA